jgi:hypothetical protein
VSTRLLAVLVLAPALLLAAGCGDDDDNGNGGEGADQAGVEAEYDITGSWSGELRQKGVDDFRVDATIGSLDDPSANTVRYTGIDCGGNWTYLGRAGSAFRFREVIDRGAGGDCKGKGTVTLTPFSADGVDYTFRGGGIESAGILKRQ